MASVYLNPTNEPRTSALSGAFHLTRIPCVGEIVQAIDDSTPGREAIWFKVVNVVHSDQERDQTQVDAELFGEVMSEAERRSVWGHGSSLYPS